MNRSISNERSYDPVDERFVTMRGIAMKKKLRIVPDEYDESLVDGRMITNEGNVLKRKGRVSKMMIQDEVSQKPIRVIDYKDG